MSTVTHTSPPRVLMPTIRRINAHAAWCSLYDFEDVIRAVDDVQLLELEQGAWFAPRHRLSRSLAWHGKHHAMTGINPGVKPVVVDRDYDVLVFVCMNMWDLLYLNAIQDWQSRCRVKICYLAEFYSWQANDFDLMLRMLAKFDYVGQAFASSVPTLSEAVGKTTRYIPFATDVARFTPFPNARPRVIDVFSIGGRYEPVHEALLKLVASRDLFYVYDTLPSPLVKPTNPKQHRDLLASMVKRSRFFVANEAKAGNQESGGQSELGARYFEGTAAGAVLFGRAPTVPTFREEFPWPDPVVEVKVDGSDVESVLQELADKPEELERVSLRNAVHALRRHDWAHRWSTMLQLAGVAPRPALTERLHALEALANNAASSSPAGDFAPARDRHSAARGEARDRKNARKPA